MVVFLRSARMSVDVALMLNPDLPERIRELRVELARSYNAYFAGAFKLLPTIKELERELFTILYRA